MDDERLLLVDAAMGGYGIAERHFYGICLWMAGRTSWGMGMK